MSAGPFLADRLITWFWPWGRRQLDNLPHRRQIFLWLIIIGVFWAGFSAWREEKDQWLATKSALDQTKMELASQPTRAAQDITRLRQQLADQSAQTMQLQQRLAYLTSDRHLTPQAINTFARFLKVADNTTRKIVVGDLSMGCADCGIYADDFAIAFRLARWTVQRENYADLNPAIRGVFVLVHDKEHPPKDALTVESALDRAKIQNQGISTWDYVKGDDVQLIVMPKPLPQ